MKIALIFLVITQICGILLLLPHAVVADDSDPSDDFTDFDDFDSDFGPVGSKNPPASSGLPDSDHLEKLQHDPSVEDDNEFEHFQDEEEFEGFINSQIDDAEPPIQNDIGEEPKLQITKVPIHFRTHWDSYWLELLMIAGLIAYSANYMIGRGINTRLVHNWLSAHRAMLEENFCLVGDDGQIEHETHHVNKESENHYTLWCSGRTCCEGMLVELKLIKRQDLLSIIAGLLKPARDQLIIKIELSKDIADNFVFAVATKKNATKLFKEQADLNKFCTLVNKAEEKYKVPAGFSVLSEISEASAGILDGRLCAALTKYSSCVEYIHISDQYSGVIQQDDASQLKQPEVKRILIAAFNLPKNTASDDDDESNWHHSKSFLMLAFYLMERLKRFRLSRESKAKADKNRQRVEEQFLKSTHAARAEAAAQRREEKRKIEKEKILGDDDPEKQRRWEKKEQKRELKKKAPRMKKLSIKAM